jgi:hypothetical protein
MEVKVHTFGEVQNKKNTSDACRQQVNDGAWNQLKKLGKSLQQASYNNKHKDKQPCNIKKQVEKKIN